MSVESFVEYAAKFPEAHQEFIQSEGCRELMRRFELEMQCYSSISGVSLEGHKA